MVITLSGCSGSVNEVGSAGPNGVFSDTFVTLARVFPTVLLGGLPQVFFAGENITFAQVVAQDGFVGIPSSNIGEISIPESGDYRVSIKGVVTAGGLDILVNGIIEDELRSFVVGPGNLNNNVIRTFTVGDSITFAANSSLGLIAPALEAALTVTFLQL